MDQIKIGKFIAECRKNKGYTQMHLAEKLNITDRAISKWENGKSMPDSSIMLELCEILDISVNELLSGEKISMENYEQKANENLIKLQKHNEATSVAAKVCFVFTIILLLILNIINMIKYGFEEATEMPSFMIMSAVTTVWIIIYLLAIRKKK